MNKVKSLLPRGKHLEDKPGSRFVQTEQCFPERERCLSQDLAIRTIAGKT